MQSLQEYRVPKACMHHLSIDCVTGCSPVAISSYRLAVATVGFAANTCQRSIACSARRCRCASILVWLRFLSMSEWSHSNSGSAFTCRMVHQANLADATRRRQRNFDGHRDSLLGSRTGAMPSRPASRSTQCCAVLCSAVQCRLSGHRRTAAGRTAGTKRTSETRELACRRRGGLQPLQPWASVPNTRHGAHSGIRVLKVAR
jgi:hypothetical protein